MQAQLRESTVGADGDTGHNPVHYIVYVQCSHPPCCLRAAAVPAPRHGCTVNPREAEARREGEGTGGRCQAPDSNRKIIARTMKVVHGRDDLEFLIDFTVSRDNSCQKRKRLTKATHNLDPQCSTLNIRTAKKAEDRTKLFKCSVSFVDSQSRRYVDLFVCSMRYIAGIGAGEVVYVPHSVRIQATG